MVFEDACVVTCPPGFQAQGGNWSVPLSCQADGTIVPDFFPGPVNCTPVPCAPPPGAPNADAAACATLRFNQTCAHLCAEGYTTPGGAGGTALMCGADGALSAAEPCELARCAGAPAADRVGGGAVVGRCTDEACTGVDPGCEGIQVGEACVFECVEGFAAGEGVEGYARCQATARGLDPPGLEYVFAVEGPNCRPRACGVAPKALRLIPGGCDGLESGQECAGECEAGYRAQGVFRCLEGKLVEVPHCIPAETPTIRSAAIRMTLVAKLASQQSGVEMMEAVQYAVASWMAVSANEVLVGQPAPVIVPTGRRLNTEVRYAFPVTCLVPAASADLLQQQAADPEQTPVLVGLINRAIQERNLPIQQVQAHTVAVEAEVVEIEVPEPLPGWGEKDPKELNFTLLWILLMSSFVALLLLVFGVWACMRVKSADKYGVLTIPEDI
mmetsp:Transcript_123952/g.284271  ORF Transcript_123952/g.284271 Transcript_123952/m.284271 type:complete len:442 (+) Transcript_123952:1-1326(+)